MIEADRLISSDDLGADWSIVGRSISSDVRVCGHDIGERSKRWIERGDTSLARRDGTRSLQQIAIRTTSNDAVADLVELFQECREWTDQVGLRRTSWKVVNPVRLVDPAPGLVTQLTSDPYLGATWLAVGYRDDMLVVLFDICLDACEGQREDIVRVLSRAIEKVGAAR